MAIDEARPSSIGQPRPSSPGGDGPARTLLLTDLVDSTRLIEQLGDEHASELMAEHARLARALLEPHGGREIDKTDGFLLLFDEAIDALRYALAYHSSLSELAAHRQVPIAARAGMHTGAVILQQATAEEIARGVKPLEVEGIAKPVAARVMSLAGAGQTLLSTDAYRRVERALDDGEAIAEGAMTIDHGLYSLKGVEEPVDIIEVGIAGAAPLSPPADVAKAYRVVPLADGGFRPARETPHNLPRDLSSFIGRQAELRELAGRFDEGSALVTVVGLGGTGKTRLACRFALTRLGDYPGGAWYCELADARTLDEVIAVVAATLGVELRDDDPVQQLGHAIAGRDSTLIVLDNFEQVVEHAPATVARWMRAAKGSRFLVTSRELLRLEGERALPVAPLSTPTGDSLDSLRSNEAAALFADRARAVAPSFALSEANAASVAQLVRLLDGLPLAIELAAARIRVLPPAKIVERLSKRFALLRGSGRDRSSRQNTLRGAIDWSWELCAPWERLAIAQCSVFRGGFDLEAAEAVLDISAWSDAPWPMDVVQALVDKSLLRSWQPEAQGERFDVAEQMFGMYFSMQEYAAEKLRDPAAVAGPDGDSLTGPESAEEIERRHGGWYAKLGSDEAVEALHGGDGPRGWSLLALERQNTAAALQRAIERVDAEETGALAQAHALASLGSIRAAVLIETLQRALDRVKLDPAWRVKVLCELGNVAAKARLGSDRSRRAFAEAVELARQQGDEKLQARALIDSASLHPTGERYEESVAVLRRARPMAERLGDRRYVVRADAFIGMHLFQLGKLEESRAVIERSLQDARAIEDRLTEARMLLGLALLNYLDGTMDESHRQMHEAVALARQLGDRYLEGHNLAVLADHHQVIGQAAEAQLLATEALGLLRQTGMRRSEGIARYVLAMAHVQLAEQNEAEVQIEEALRALHDASDRHELCIALSCRARIEQARGDVAAALATLDEAEAIIAELGVGPDSEPAKRVAEARAAVAGSSQH